jgi:hypothetical protein
MTKLASGTGRALLSRNSFVCLWYPFFLEANKPQSLMRSEGLAKLINTASYGLETAVYFTWDSITLFRRYDVGLLLMKQFKMFVYYTEK